MTTDNTQAELDEIILRLARYANTLTPYKLDEPIDPIVADGLAEVKQALLDWHTKRVERVLDRLEQENIAEPCEPDCSEMRHARHEGAYAHSVLIVKAIEAEREKLNNPDGDVK